MALMNCAECQREMSEKAESCPGCGAPNKQKHNLSAKEIVLISALPLLMLYLLVKWQIGEPEPTKPAISVNLSDITQAYRRDELQAHQKFSGKTIRTTGTYTTSGVSLGAPWVVITDERLGGAQCHLKRGTRAPNLKKGQTITVMGKVFEKVVYIQLNDCRITSS